MPKKLNIYSKFGKEFPKDIYFQRPKMTKELAKEVIDLALSSPAEFKARGYTKEDLDRALEVESNGS